MTPSSIFKLAAVAAGLVCLGLFLTIGFFGSSNSSYEITGISFGGPPATYPAPTAPGNPAQGASALDDSGEQMVEASFQSEPFRCRLAFGPNREHVILTAADLEAQWLYVDLNSDGKLDDVNESFEILETGQYNETRNLSAVVPEISVGDDTHTNLKIQYGQTGDRVRGVFSVQLLGSSDLTTDADLIPLELSNNSDTIPLLHFGGPLTMGNYRKVVEMERGEEVKFYSLLRTVGESGGTLTAIANTEIDGEAHPKAEFEFPHEDPSKPAIQVTAYLPTRC